MGEQGSFGARDRCPPLSRANIAVFSRYFHRRPNPRPGVVTASPHRGGGGGGDQLFTRAETKNFDPCTFLPRSPTGRRNQERRKRRPVGEQGSFGARPRARSCLRPHAQGARRVRPSSGSEFYSDSDNEPCRTRTFGAGTSPFHHPKSATQSAASRTGRLSNNPLIGVHYRSLGVPKAERRPELWQASAEKSLGMSGRHSDSADACQRAVPEGWGGAALELDRSNLLCLGLGLGIRGGSLPGGAAAADAGESAGDREQKGTKPKRTPHQTPPGERRRGQHCRARLGSAPPHETRSPTGRRNQERRKRRPVGEQGSFGARDRCSKNS